MNKRLASDCRRCRLAACGGKAGRLRGGSGEQIKVVGSSTVYPFTNAVAEEFQRANPGTSVIVESTGTGAGSSCSARASAPISPTSSTLRGR